MILVATPSAPVMRVTRPFRIVDLSGISLPRVVVSGSSSEISVGDRRVNRVTESNLVSDYQLRLETFGGAGRYAADYESLTPTIAQVDALGKVTWLADGSATIRATVNGVSRDVTLPMSTTVGQTAYIFLNHLSGSLAAHAAQTVDSRLAGKSAATALRIFSSQDHTNGVYVRNPNVWCADLPNLLTCLSPWNSSGANTRAGTLISPRHILFAAHYEINTGATVRFVKMDGTVVTRTMTAKLRHPSYSPHYPDLTVGVLDSDVPGDIAFCRVLPDNWASYLPSQNTYNDGRLPCLTLDQEEKALVTDWYREQTSTLFTVPTDPKRLEFYEPKIGGDSGNPAILPVNGLPVLLTVWTSGGAGSGTSVRQFKADINTLMTTLGGGYQLTEIDLSGFSTY